MSKREVPQLLQHVLKLDIALTNAFCTVFQKIFPYEKYRTHFRRLELTCHGIPWIVFWLIYIWAVWTPSKFEMQVNFFMGLLVDIIGVAVLKAFTRRRRPPGNKPDMLLMVGPDKFSFPSGHVSRAVFVSAFFTWLYPLGSTLAFLALWSWAGAVSLTRVLLRRHHILDVAAGAALGFLETIVLSVLWLGPDASQWLVLWLSEENVTSSE